MPDTITRQLGNVITIHTIQATAFDADGLNDIRWVGFTSRHFKNTNGDKNENNDKNDNKNNDEDGKYAYG